MSTVTYHINNHFFKNTLNRYKDVHVLKQVIDIAIVFDHKHIGRNGLRICNLLTCTVKC